MRARSRKRGSHGFVAFILGAAAGGLTALLCAPTSGRIARRRLAMRAQGIRRRTSQQLIALRRETAQKAEQLRGQATDWLSEYVHTPNGHAKRPVRHRVTRHA